VASKKKLPFDGRRLYRFFDTAEHADALTQGKVWISTLETCRRYENEHQGDPAEGQQYLEPPPSVGHGDDPELVAAARRQGFGIGPGARDVFIHDNVFIGGMPDAFLLCTTKRFDPAAFAGWWNTNFCCEITDGGEFFRLVTERLRGLFGSRLALWVVEDVVYGGIVGMAGPGGFVKAPRYQGQEEVRMVWEVPDPYRYESFQLYAPEVAPLCRRIL
jgi:hypothetical protein